MSETILYQFSGSHYNEKARWALDWKGAAHERQSLLPGPHMRTVKKLTNGATVQVPVLVEAQQVIPGSAAIIEHLERLHPEPALYPADPTQRARALEIQSEFDEQVGPATRLALFHEVMDARYALSLFAEGQTAFARVAYRAAFPAVHQVMKKTMKINDQSAATARVRSREALDFVAAEAGPSGYLVGERFSVADLCCAALLMPCVDVSDLGGPAPARGPKLDGWYARWAELPGAEWVREIYRRHRAGPASA